MSSCPSMSRIARACSAGGACSGGEPENNFAGRNRPRRPGVESTTPGGVPPSPQPLTHPARDPGPLLAPGSSFIGPLWKTRYENLGAFACERMHARVTHAGLVSAPGWRTSPLRDETRRVSFAGVTAAPRAGSRRLNPPQHQIVPVHHLGAAAAPEDRENVGGGAAFDFARVVRVIGDEAATDLEPIGPADDHRISARETTVDLDDARGQ